jgi:hypothetical protein
MSKTVFDIPEAVGHTLETENPISGGVHERKMSDFFFPDMRKWL